MEVQENLRSNPQEDYLRKNSQNNSRGKDLGIALLNILLAVITVVLLGYIAYKNGYIDLDNILNIQKEEKTEEETEDNPVDSGLTTYEGDYFTAVLPIEWTITEYQDGEGITMIAGGDPEYIGLTGVVIADNGDEIMKLEGVTGIGFIGCPELPKFEDTDPDYEAIKENLVSELGADEIQYLDFTDTPYSEFTWLGKRIRRVGTALYYDTIDGDEYFEPQCEVSFIRLENFGFEDENGQNKGDTYMYTISEEATDDQLENLDKILTSMAII